MTVESSATASHERSSFPLSSAEAKPIRKGDIRRVKALLGLEAQPRIALIVRATDLNHDYAEIMLTHQRVKMATPDDVILNVDDPQFPHGLVVQTRLRGAVWNLQFTELLGHLSRSQMTSVACITSSRMPQPADVTTGRPILRSTDERIAFQKNELQALWNLTGDCADAMLDEDTPWRVDTDLLSPALLERSHTPELILTEIMHILRTRQVIATFDDLRALAESGAFDTSSWQKTSYGHGLASQIATGTKLLMEHALQDTSDTDGQDPTTRLSCVLTHRIPDARTLSLKPHSRLVTAPFLWTNSGDLLLTDTDDSDGQLGLEVMMLATPDYGVAEEDEVDDS